MIKFIAVIAGEPNSINSEIIVKAWKKIKIKNKLFIIGNYKFLKNQINKIGLNIKIIEINSLKQIKDLKKLYILNVPFKYKSLFENNVLDTKKYLFKCLDVAHDLAINKKIKGFINAPINKKIFSKKLLGVTEYLANKNNIKNKEVMMIYNKNLSVVPLTTHMEIKNVTNNIKSSLIREKILTLNRSYSKLFKKKPKIAILGLNPHNSENRKDSVENIIIKPTVEKLIKLGVNIKGPFP